MHSPILDGCDAFVKWMEHHSIAIGIAVIAALGGLHLLLALLGIAIRTIHEAWSHLRSFTKGPKRRHKSAESKRELAALQSPLGENGSRAHLRPTTTKTYNHSINLWSTPVNGRKAC